MAVSPKAAAQMILLSFSNRPGEAALKTWAEGQSALLDVARTLGTRTEFQDSLQFLFQRAIKNGLGDHDISALVNVLEAE